MKFYLRKSASKIILLIKSYKIIKNIILIIKINKNVKFLYLKYFYNSNNA